MLKNVNAALLLEEPFSMRSMIILLTDKTGK